MRENGNRRLARAADRNEYRHFACISRHTHFAPARSSRRRKRMRWGIRVAVGRVRRIGQRERAARACCSAHVLCCENSLRASFSLEVVHAQCVALALGHHLKADDDFLLLAGSDREDSRAKHSVAHPLDERGIALLPHDLLIDTARTLGAHRLASDELTVDGELQVLEGCTPGERKDVIRFAEAAATVDEGFGHLVAQHAIREVGAHVSGGLHDARSLRPARHAWPLARARLGDTSRYYSPLGHGGGGDD